MGLVIPPTIGFKANPSPLQALSQSEARDTSFWAKLLKIREFMAICKVKVFQDNKGNEYFRIDNINEIDYKKKKEEHKREVLMLDSFEENKEQL